MLPKLAILYISGYDRDLIDQKALETTASLLPKPFTPASLLARIGDLLGSQRWIEPGKTRPAAS